MKMWVIGGNKNEPEEVEITEVGTNNRVWTIGDSAFFTEPEARAAYREEFINLAERLEAEAKDTMTRAAGLRERARKWE